MVFLVVAPSLGGSEQLTQSPCPQSHLLSAPVQRNQQSIPAHLQMAFPKVLHPPQRGSPYFHLGIA